MTEIIDAHPDVDVHIHEAEWTLAELIVGRDIAVEILTSDDFAGLELETIGPKPDASGLKVALGDTTPKEVKAVKKAVAKATDIRVFVETGVHTVPAAG